MCLWTFSYLFEFFFFKQKTAYELRISDWSSDVCSSDLRIRRSPQRRARDPGGEAAGIAAGTPRDGGGLSARATRTLRPRLPRPAVRPRGERPHRGARAARGAPCSRRGRDRGAGASPPRARVVGGRSRAPAPSGTAASGDRRWTYV